MITLGWLRLNENHSRLIVAENAGGCKWNPHAAAICAGGETFRYHYVDGTHRAF
ncbi:hypothetical protein [Noviherbaspirillum sp.]|uniref:hypothetical protein n=1 Tax=Noviherbaspirillum sp. TaxID=1926288 RepID=UPI002D7018DA|nr:hypothetical protein [Noviherbaspirillum sp.]HZW20484.1 hypothetical protein [Noviherbaspirillum sp.]